MNNRIVITVSLLVAFSSCHRETIAPTVKGESTITIEATIADDISVKTNRKSDGKVYWHPGDQLNVFLGDDSGVFSAINEEDTRKTSFTGSITTSNEGGNEVNHIWGLYPFDEHAYFDGTYVHTSLSAIQKGEAETFAEKSYITLAKNDSFALSFYNVLAGIRFTLQQEGITSICFSGNNEEVLTGDLSLCFGEDSRPIVSDVTNGGRTITLLPMADTFSVGEYYYILFVPTVFENGFTMSFNRPGEEAILNYNKRANFRRNTFGTLREADKGLSFETQQSNEIWYTSSDNEVLIPIVEARNWEYYDYGNDEFDYTSCGIISNTYSNGKGKIVYDSDVKYVRKRYYGLVDQQKNRLTSISFPESVLSIGYMSMEGCENLTEVLLPSSLNEIEAEAFVGCSKLSSISIPQSVTSIGNDVFMNCSSLKRFEGKFAAPDGLSLVDGTVLRGVIDGVKSFTVPDNVRDISSHMPTSLEYIYFNDGTKNIGDGVFRGCSNLKAVNMPETVTYVGSAAFSGCTSLTSIVFPRNVTNIGNEVLYHCTSLQSITLLSPTPANNSDDGDFNPFYGTDNVPIYVPASALSTYQNNWYWAQYKSRLTVASNIQFSDASVKSICISRWDTNNDGELSFDEAAAVTTLGNAFQNNTDITDFFELQYFTGLNSISNAAFKGCISLKSGIK